MTALFDVAARLAEGRAALEDAHTYVSAARQRGHSNPELTDLASWYGTEHGLDLQRLHADRAALETAARAATEAVDLARGQLAALVRAWTGPGASASVEFIRRHCDSAAALADALTVAAQTCAALREELWRAVDAKVAATTAIVERVGTRRQSWLSAAQAVLTGAPDEAAADIVDAQVAPFVATAIGNEWLRDMRATTESARGAYRRGIDVLGQWRGVQFEVPGDLGPRLVSAAPQQALQPLAPAAEPVPAPQQVLQPLAPAAEPVPAPAPLPTLPQTAPPVPAALPDLGAAAGIPGRVAEALGGLLGAPDADVPDVGTAGPGIEPPELAELGPPELGPPELDEPDLDESEEAPDAEDEPAPDERTDLEAEEPAEDTESEPEAVPAATEPEPERVPEPDCLPSAPVAAPPPPPVPAATPCEMAADELPQVGE